MSLFAKTEAVNPMSSNNVPPFNATSVGLTFEELSRVFNTAVVSTRAESIRDFSTELFTLVDSPAFKALLHGVKQLARTQGISEREAAEQMIETFRKLDKIWGEYIFQEGVDRIKNQMAGGQN